MGDEAVLIHGCLDVTIFKGEHLHPTISGIIHEATEKAEKVLHLESHHKLYATLDIGIARVARTREVGFHPFDPKWDESFKVYAAHTASVVTISIKKQLPVSAKVLGRVHIPASRVLTGEPIEGWFDLVDEEGKHIKKARVEAYLKFNHVTADPCWNSGIKLHAYRGIPNAFFSEREGCAVTLYHNSHLSNRFHPRIELAGGEMYRPHRLWEDLYKGIVEAKHFVYIAGWSVNVNITLIRDPERMIPGAENVTLGELLKWKAEEGVKVLVMVWQDRTSISFLGNAGLMKTHDEETHEFFKGSKVPCFLCPRNADRSLTAVQSVEVSAEFTHHQKIVLHDAPAAGPDRHRKLVAYVGGIDLSTGRYDNEIHSLFQNLDTTYKNDFLQGNFPGASLRLGGPREPWHDDHSKVEGLAAWDVLANFEQRWLKQAPRELVDALLPLRENPDMFPPVTEESMRESMWNVQVFRSIDDSSVVGFPPDPKEASRLGLMCGKDVTIDQSIHSGYIEAIRRAQRFIYIENQYFLGSCSSWMTGNDMDRDCGCLNLIPIEIALKIASKIKEGERFAAYIVTPMWPEGEPGGSTVQSILHWNRLTMEMMYKIVAQAIEEAGLCGKAHPCDYLNFYCLGNREVQRPGEYVPPEQPKPESDYWRAQVNRRFMIYVHAKIMIVDDEYIIVGSANLNQRSLGGDRDTEIAHGSYQPAHLNSLNGHALGQIYGYRMSLWYEHFMSHCPHLHHIFVRPERVECVRMVKQISENLWEKFVGDEVVDLPGHLLPFPIQVSETGELSELTVDGYYPDTTAHIKGNWSIDRPAILTT